MSDYKGFDLLVDDDAPAAKVFIDDRDYDSDHIRKTIQQRGGTPIIPGRKSRKQHIQAEPFVYALRNHVERCFNKLKCSRRLATRYDKTAASYLGFVQLAAARLWTKQFVNRT